ncbi:hypothetical protein GF378_02535 [Candidatus Pacearchaeota archaeon]|nr:hypothetical protein [Candidatus Pacearchaeota archaeon]
MAAKKEKGRKKGKNKDKNNQQELSKKTKIVVIFALLFFIIVIALIFNANKVFYLQKYDVPIRTVVGNETVFNISKNDTILNLGTVKYGGDMQRSLEISNDYSFPTRFSFEVTGDIKDLIAYPEASYLRAKEDILVPFSTEIKESTEKGVYSGVIHVKVQKFTGKFKDKINISDALKSNNS